MTIKQDLEGQFEAGFAPFVNWRKGFDYSFNQYLSSASGVYVPLSQIVGTVKTEGKASFANANPFKTKYDKLPDAEKAFVKATYLKLIK